MMGGQRATSHSRTRGYIGLCHVEGKGSAFLSIAVGMDLMENVNGSSITQQQLFTEPLNLRELLLIQASYKYTRHLWGLSFSEVLNLVIALDQSV